MEQRVDRRSLPYDPRKLDGITLKALLEKYRDEVIPRKRCTDRETNLLNAFIARSPKLASMPLSAISASHFCIYRDQRLKSVKPATICRELLIFIGITHTLLKPLSKRLSFDSSFLFL